MQGKHCFFVHSATEIVAPVCTWLISMTCCSCGIQDSIKSHRNSLFPEASRMDFSWNRATAVAPYFVPMDTAKTERKNDCACVTSDPVGKAVGAEISTWATYSEWKTLESLDFAVKFQLVFRYETVVFRRYVLALLLVVLLRKFDAYLVYLSLIWGKFPIRGQMHDWPASSLQSFSLCVLKWRNVLRI